MKKVLTVLDIGLLILSACSENNDSSEDIDNSNSSLDEYPLRDQYVDSTSLTMAKGVDMEKVEAYCEDHKEDTGWPRVRKYVFDDLTYYDDEWVTMGNYGANYCYKFYNGISLSNGNPLYLKEFYIFPELNRFLFNYSYYEYPSVESSGLSMYGIRIYQPLCSFLIDSSASDLISGSYYTTSFVLSNGSYVSWANLAFVFFEDYFVPPSGFPYAVDTTYAYGIGDCSSTSGITQEWLDETATSCYNKLRGTISFADDFLKLVDSSYSLIS